MKKFIGRAPLLQLLVFISNSLGAPENATLSLLTLPSDTSSMVSPALNLIQLVTVPELDRGSEQLFSHLRFNTTSRKKRHAFNDNIQRSPITGRIVDGEIALRSEAAFHVEIRYGGLFACSGALTLAPQTGEQIVLTTATCVSETQPTKSYVSMRDRKRFTVYAGRVVRSLSDSVGQHRGVRNIVRHPEFVRLAERQDDIAIIYLDKAFTINANVKPLPLPSKANVYPPVGSQLIVTGWGWTSYVGSSNTDQLLLTTMEIIAWRDCWREYRDFLGIFPLYDYDYVYPGTLCARSISGGRNGPSYGDEGAPARARGAAEHYLAGIFSRIRLKEDPRYPRSSLFMSTSYYLNWIIGATRPCLL